MNNPNKKIFLIDANSLVHRAFHALPPLTSPSGAPVQAVYGVASILLKLWKEEKPRYAAAFFDRPEPTFRKEKYAAYKAQRPKAPDELIAQIIEAHRLFAAFGIGVFEAPGWEADDLIATAAGKFRHLTPDQVVILTGDLDTLQLVEDEHVVVWALKTGISEVMKYGDTAVRARYGLAPGQLPDYKALVGDPSDNVKGVPGIGPKTAAAFLQKFGTLEKLYEAAPSDEKLKTKLLPYREEAELSKMLVTLRADAPLAADSLPAVEVAENLDTAKAYFEALGFRALVKRMGGEPTQQKVEIEKKGLPAEVLTKAGPLPLHEFVVGEEAIHFEGLKVGFNLKSWLKSAWEKSEDGAAPYWDLGVGAWLIDPDFKTYDPASIAHRFLGTPWMNTKDEYEKLFAWEYHTLAAHNLNTVFETIEMPLLRVLAEMEQKGVALSKERLTSLLSKVDARLRELEKGIYAHAGEVFNLNSPREVSRILFEKLGIRGKSVTRTGLKSTREEALLGVADVHPIVRELLEYREFFKARSTYLGPLLDCIEEDGRVHTDFVQTGTGTGRLSSRDPNLQNIPQTFVLAKELRGAFIAPVGSSLVACDYTQLELRILAALSGDEELVAAFHRGDDLHRLTAARVLGIAPEAVGDKERRLAKTLNFGLMYGMGARAFAQAAGVSAEEAKKFIGQYFKTFERVKEWQELIKKEAREEGYVQTLTGRRRYIPGSRSAVPRFRAEAERVAVNFPIQGLEADIVKLAMVRIRDLFHAEGWGQSAAMLLSIHDELLFEIRDDMIALIAPKIREVMESAYPLSVPLTVKISRGKDWGHMETLTL